jgi:hypothetical protein
MATDEMIKTLTYLMKIVNPDKYSINDCQGKENEVLYNLT